MRVLFDTTEILVGGIGGSSERTGTSLDLEGRHFGHLGFHRLSSSELDTTQTLEKAIAAPASVGLKYPNAAAGMPTTL